VSKFVAFQIEICISGKVSPDLPHPVKAVQHSCHGVAYIILIPIPYAFCDIVKDGCLDMTPACGSKEEGVALVPGQDFCMCSELEVPTIAPPGVSKKIKYQDYKGDVSELL
jgi:hypothetical protein